MKNSRIEIDWIPYNIEDIKGKYLFKFLSGKNLVKFLDTGNIWFSRSDKFGDKLECVSITDLKKDTIDLQIVEQRKKQHLISCFHLATNESLAFWDTYAKEEDDRRIYALKFNREEFCNKIIASKIPIEAEKIEKLVHGKVAYKNLLSSNRATLVKRKVKHTSLRKEYAFRYEKEYRFVIKTKKEFSKAGVNIHWGNLKTEKFQILVNPLLDDEAYIEAIEFLNKKGFFKKFEITRITKFFKPELV